MKELGVDWFMDRGKLPALRGIRFVREILGMNMEDSDCFPGYVSVKLIDTLFSGLHARNNDFRVIFLDIVLKYNLYPFSASRKVHDYLDWPVYELMAKLLHTLGHPLKWSSRVVEMDALLAECRLGGGDEELTMMGGAGGGGGAGGRSFGQEDAEQAAAAGGGSLEEEDEDFFFAGAEHPSRSTEHDTAPTSSDKTKTADAGDDHAPNPPRTAGAQDGPAKAKHVVPPPPHQQHPPILPASTKSPHAPARLRAWNKLLFQTHRWPQTRRRQFFAEYLLLFLQRFAKSGTADVPGTGANPAPLQLGFPYYNKPLFHETLVNDVCEEYRWFYALTQLALDPEMSFITPGYVIRTQEEFVVGRDRVALAKQHIGKESHITFVKSAMNCRGIAVPLSLPTRPHSRGTVVRTT